MNCPTEVWNLVPATTQSGKRALSFEIGQVTGSYCSAHANVVATGEGGRCFNEAGELRCSRLHTCYYLFRNSPVPTGVSGWLLNSTVELCLSLCMNRSKISGRCLLLPAMAPFCFCRVSKHSVPSHFVESRQFRAFKNTRRPPVTPSVLSRDCCCCRC